MDSDKCPYCNGIGGTHNYNIPHPEPKKEKSSSRFDLVKIILFIALALAVVSIFISYEQAGKINTLIYNLNRTNSTTNNIAMNQGAWDTATDAWMKQVNEALGILNNRTLPLIPHK